MIFLKKFQSPDICNVYKNRNKLIINKNLLYVPQLNNNEDVATETF